MKLDLPTPDQIIEELADKTATQIDRLAPVAFDAALNELLRHHRFLLAVNATRLPDGAPFNFAEVAGLAWSAPHEEWIRQYRRLFERAADRIGDDPSFLAKLARIPIRLLPREGEPEFSTAVLRAILDLGPVLVHRLEAWVTKRTVVEQREGEALARQGLAGSDKKAYDAIVADVVAAWENLLQQGASLFFDRSERRAPHPERWAILSTSWPFLWRHLTNTAYLLAAAVWNEDSTGAELYRDTLVRWPQTLGHDSAERAELIERRLLFPDIRTLKWDRALTQLGPILPDYLPAPTPDHAFNAILRGAHDDIILLTSALLLSWTMNEKQQSDLGAQTASLLLRREPADPRDRKRGGAVARPLSSLTLDVVRLYLAGERFRNEGYGAELDHAVAALDNMTERRVISGRVFTPSTFHEREDLLLPIVVLLLSALPPDEPDELHTREAVRLRSRIERLAADEKALPEGDRSLRKLLHEFGLIKSALETSSQHLQHGLAVLRPGANFEVSSTRLRAVVAELMSAIEKQRIARLREREPDPAKIERLRTAMEAAVLTPPANVPFFREFAIETGPVPSDVPAFSIRLNGIAKGELVEPPMETESSNMVEVFAAHVRDGAGNRVWRLFCSRPRERIAIPARVEDDDFWKQIEPLVVQVGTAPILVVSREAEGRAIRRLLYPTSDDKPAMKVDRKPRGDVGGHYIATVDGVDVFGADFDPGEAWLFSARALQRLSYAPLDDAGHAVTLAFEPTDEKKGSLRVQFRQSAEWADGPVFEIALDDPQDA
jgi:hypothetical protein